MTRGIATENSCVLVIGRSCVDIIAVIEQFPREDTKVPMVCRMREGGGQGGTASCCIARLGGTVVYCGHLGDDEEGRFCLRRLEDFGVDTRFVEVIPGGKTPIAYILVTRTGGSRTIVYEPSTLPRVHKDRLIDMRDIPFGVALLDPEVTYLIQDVKDLSGGKTRIVYDCERWNEYIPVAMVVSDYFIPSAEFLDAKELGLKGLSFFQQVFSLSRMISGTLVVTRGSEGAYYVCEDRLIHVSAPPVKVKDTTGAGDSFHGAFSFALSRGFDLSTAVKLSVAVASLSCREYGGRAGLPDFSQAWQLATTLSERVVATE